MSILCFILFMIPSCNQQEALKDDLAGATGIGNPVVESAKIRFQLRLDTNTAPSLLKATRQVRVLKDSDGSEIILDSLLLSIDNLKWLADDSANSGTQEFSHILFDFNLLDTQTGFEMEVREGNYRKIEIDYGGKLSAHQGDFYLQGRILIDSQWFRFEMEEDINLKSKFMFKSDLLVVKAGEPLNFF